MPRDIVFIHRGGSGIGMGLAGAFHARGALVIIGGRTPAKLAAVAWRYPGMEVDAIDVADAGSIRACAGRLAERHPDLNVLINNAGVQRMVDFTADIPIDPDLIEQEIGTNLTGLIQTVSAFLPGLRRQPKARIVNIGSWLAFVPLISVPIYSATKAAVHAFTVALREQLAGSAVDVVEIIPRSSRPICTMVRRGVQGGHGARRLRAGRDGRSRCRPSRDPGWLGEGSADRIEGRTRFLSQDDQQATIDRSLCRT